MPNKILKQQPTPPKQSQKKTKGTSNPATPASSSVDIAELLKLLREAGASGTSGVTPTTPQGYNPGYNRRVGFFNEKVPYLNNLITPDYLGFGIGRNLLGIGPGNSEKFPGLLGWITGMYNEPSQNTAPIATPTGLVPVSDITKQLEDWVQRTSFLGGINP